MITESETEVENEAEENDKILKKIRYSREKDLNKEIEVEFLLIFLDDLKKRYFLLLEFRSSLVHR